MAKLFNTSSIPGQAYLWLAILILGASSAVTRKITEIGAQHFIGGENPISLCNVLFVGNLCGLLALILIHRQQWDWANVMRLSRREWIGLVLVATLSGALAPGLIFQALALTPVTNVVLIGRLEPPLILALSIWLFKDRVSQLEILGAIAAFIGIALIILLQPVKSTMMSMAGFHIGLGELLTAIGAIILAISTLISKKRLSQVPLGLYGMVRTGLGTIIFFVLALVLYGHDHFQGVLSPFLWQWMLLYGIVIIVVGQSLWITGLRATSVSAATIVSSFAPIIGILAAYLILGEVPTSAHYIGGSLTLLGLLLSQIGLYRRMTQATALVKHVDQEQAIDANMGHKGI
jgi:drug/metabolite transporter (DMT)-like permease